MRQPGRKSIANLTLLPGVDGRPPRLAPPRYLRRAERALFNEIIAGCDPRHFLESDLPILCSYVQASLLSRRSARDPRKVATWEKATRVQASLAVRLRLTPSARSDPKTLARRQEAKGPHPWEL